MFHDHLCAGVRGLPGHHGFKSLDTIPYRDLPGWQASEIAVSQLIGAVPAATLRPYRSRLLVCLLKTLGVLVPVAVINGIFAKIRFRGGWPVQHILLDDANLAQPAVITALVDRVQQVCGDAVNGLANIVSVSPVLASLIVAALLVVAPIQHARAGHAAQEASGNDADLELRR